MFDSTLLERFSKTKTPFYYYDLNLLRATLGEIKKESGRYGYHVHYAFKANCNDAVLREIQLSGLGADCVSGNEVKKALDSGFPNSKIVFAGVGKTDEEIIHALEAGIFCFNCESAMEFDVINELAAARNLTAKVAIRINPNVNANTHKYITTGLEENKFGISISQLPEVVEQIKQCKNLELIGLHFHIGSQITDMNAFKSLCTRVNELQKWFVSRGIKLQHINAGGGLGIDYYHPEQKPITDFKTYFELFNRFLELLPGQELHFELGRAIVGQCGSLITRVLYVKNGLNTDFLIVDAGMTELIRPALYQSFHLIQTIQPGAASRTKKKYDVVGPICESSDCFGKSVELPETFRGDLIAIRSAGAYGEVMSSQYNLRERVQTVLSE